MSRNHPKHPEHKENLPAEVNKESNLPVNIGFDDELASLLPRAEASDFNIERLTLVQPTSKIEGNPGDLIDSGTKEAVTSMGKPFRFVPVFFAKDIAISEKSAGGNGKWIRNEMKGPNNAHLTTSENKFGVEKDEKGKDREVERKERLNIFLIKETDLDSEFPRVYRMILKPSSFKEAKKFLAEWDIAIRCRQAPYTKIWQITPRMEVNEKGKYAVLDFLKVMENGQQKSITQDQLAPIQYWVKTLVAKKDQALHDNGEEEEVAEAAAQTHEF